MASTTVKSKDTVTLKGSAEMIVEFFNFGINSILYQRGIYAAETFRTEKYYGVPMLITDDKKLEDYITNILKQIKEWLVAKTIQKIVLVITSMDTLEDIERWQFDVECDKEATLDPGYSKDKPVKEIRSEIQAVFRQIVASVTLLPLIDEPCSFDVLVYTDKDEEVPVQWEESDPHFIAKSTEIRMKNFSTGVHKVDAMIAYKTDF
eukprot:gene17587-19340_t